MANRRYRILMLLSPENPYIVNRNIFLHLHLESFNCGPDFKLAQKLNKIQIL